MLKTTIFVLLLSCLQNVHNVLCGCDQNEHREGIFQSGEDEAGYGGNLVEHVKVLDAQVVSCMKGEKEKCHTDNQGGLNIKYIQDNRKYGIVLSVCQHREI